MAPKYLNAKNHPVLDPSMVGAVTNDAGPWFDCRGVPSVHAFIRSVTGTATAVLQGSNDMVNVHGANLGTITGNVASTISNPFAFGRLLVATGDAGNTIDEVWYYATLYGGP